jgi:4-diphosphocytidyl-2-C-methyl-D-erythritol kinase
MHALYDVPAPAKLNLFLHVLGRRSDGYHLLQSVFMLIDWCDSLHFERRGDGQISREDLAGTLPEEDLIVRAARALQRASGCRLGAHVGVVKCIPEQAGMGGGSSDAASTLLALNRLWRLGLRRSQLMALAATLGADVPFFLGGSNAWAEGIGERLTPLQGPARIPRQRFVVLKPSAGLQTAAIFSRLSAPDYFGNATISGFAADHFGFGRNDLQSVAQVLCPEISQALLWLESLGLHGRMTGSGSAVFAAVPHDADLPPPPGAWQLKMCDNLMLHPLAGWVSE